MFVEPKSEVKQKPRRGEMFLPQEVRSQETECS